MKKLIHLILLLPLVALATPATNLQSRLAKLKSLSANFKQTVLTEDGMLLQSSNGHLAIQKPGKFRWEIQQPAKQLIITDGQQVWIYDPDLKQVIIRKLSNSISQTPILLLSTSDVDLSKEFMVREQGDTFTLVPRAANQGFQSAQLIMKGDQVQAMNLKTSLGQTTKITFSEVKYNPQLPSSLFSFTPPHGVDVVRN